MKLNLKIEGIDYEMDTNQAISLAIALKFNDAQPNHFGADIASKESLQGGDFVGDTKRVVAVMSTALPWFHIVMGHILNLLLILCTKRSPLVKI